MSKTWSEKLDDPRPHQIKPAPVDIAGMRKGEIMLVPTARMVADFIAAIPAGNSMDVKAFRKALAQRFEAEVTCPITTGFHLRTVAEAALEAKRAGKPLAEITPFWRVLDAKAPTTAKLSCGEGFVTAQRRREGIDQGA